MNHPSPDPHLALAYLEGTVDARPLFEHAQRLRDEGKGRRVSFSRKVFIPLTTLCRDKCTYCTFAQPPGAGGMFLTPEEVLGVAEAGARYGCTEALFTLGDRPEDRWPQAAEFLQKGGLLLHDRVRGGDERNGPRANRPISPCQPGSDE